MGSGVHVGVGDWEVSNVLGRLGAKAGWMVDCIASVSITALRASHRLDNRKMRGAAWLNHCVVRGARQTDDNRHVLRPISWLGSRRGARLSLSAIDREDSVECRVQVVEEPATLLQKLVRLTLRFSAHDSVEDEASISVQLEEVSIGIILSKGGWAKLTGTHWFSLNLRKQLLQGIFWLPLILVLQTALMRFPKSILTAQQLQRRAEDSMVLRESECSLKTTSLELLTRITDSLW